MKNEENSEEQLPHEMLNNIHQEEIENVEKKSKSLDAYKISLLLLILASLSIQISSIIFNGKYFGLISEIDGKIIESENNLRESQNLLNEATNQLAISNKSLSDTRNEIEKSGWKLDELLKREAIYSNTVENKIGAIKLLESVKPQIELSALFFDNNPRYATIALCLYNRGEFRSAYRLDSFKVYSLDRSGNPAYEVNIENMDENRISGEILSNQKIERRINFRTINFNRQKNSFLIKTYMKVEADKKISDIIKNTVSDTGIYASENFFQHSVWFGYYFTHPGPKRYYSDSNVNTCYQSF